MSTNPTNPTEQEQDRLDAILERVAIPNPLLSGDAATVRFTFVVTGGSTPQQCVAMAMQRLMQVGTNASIFEVIDDDGTVYLTRGPYTFDPDAFEGILAEVEDLAGGDD